MKEGIIIVVLTIMCIMSLFAMTEQTPSISAQALDDRKALIEHVRSM